MSMLCVRGLRVSQLELRVNDEADSFTGTQMVKGIEKAWREQGIAENAPKDVAQAIVLCATANRGENGETHEGAAMPFEGKIVWVGGGESYEIEDNIQRLEPQWLGEENSRVLAKGQELLASPGTSWDAPKKSTS